MIDVFEVAELIVSNAVDAHGNDIDLVAYHGSWAQGTARPDSDLDIFYTPRDGTDPPVGKTFLLEGRLFDFWAIRWETLEGFATGRVRGFSFAPAVVHHAKLLHVRNEEASARFDGLKDLVAEQLTPDARPRMVRRAVGAFPKALAGLGELRLTAAEGDLPGARRAGWELIRAAIECLALANQMYFHRGMGAALGELDRLTERPDDLTDLVRAIAVSTDPARVEEAGERLAVGTRAVLYRLAESLPEERSVREQFREVYPEIRDMVTKILAACEDGDPVRAGAAAWHLRADLHDMLAPVTGPGHPGPDLPDLLEVSPEDPEGLARCARDLDESLRSWLTGRNVELSEYESLEELRLGLDLRA